jgi:hypothetical protein
VLKKKRRGEKIEIGGNVSGMIEIMIMMAIETSTSNDSLTSGNLLLGLKIQLLNKVGMVMRPLEE